MIMTFIYIVAWVGLVLGLFFTGVGIYFELEQNSKKGQLEVMLRGYRYEYHIGKPLLIAVICAAWIIATHVS